MCSKQATHVRMRRLRPPGGGCGLTWSPGSPGHTPRSPAGSPCCGPAPVLVHAVSLLARLRLSPHVHSLPARGSDGCRARAPRCHAYGRSSAQSVTKVAFGAFFSPTAVARPAAVANRPHPPNIRVRWPIRQGNTAPCGQKQQHQQCVSKPQWINSDSSYLKRMFQEFCYFNSHNYDLQKKKGQKQ